MKPRSYQLELFEAASRGNCLVCLNTGAGKTFIAVMLIKSMAHEIRGKYGEEWKRTVFLVPSVPLVHQQAETIKVHTSLRVHGFTGDMDVDNWDLEMWKKFFNDFDVLVMTAQILVNLMHSAFISKKNINLLIFDECHNAIKNHPYVQVMSFPCKDPPRVLGLTASIVNKVLAADRVETMEKLLEEEITRVEQIFNARCVTTSNPNEVLDYSGRPDENVLPFESYEEKILSTDCAAKELYLEVEEKLNSVQDFIDSYKGNSHNPIPDATRSILKQVKSICRQMTDILHDVGIIGVYKASLAFKTRIASGCHDISIGANQVWLELVHSTIQFVTMACETFAIQTFGSIEKMEYKEPFISNKLSVLYDELCKQSQGLSCIVFVKTRCKAVVLSNMLNAMSEQQGTAISIKSQYILGHASDMRIELADITMKSSMQQKIVSEFKQQKFSILFSTSVVEEGIDIHSCNLVIRYDGLLHYREYIQSKGRARQLKSKFLFMAEKCDVPQARNQIKLMNFMGHALLRICKNRDVSKIVPWVPSFEIDPYIPFDNETGPRITQHSCISLLNNYCSVIQKSNVYPPQYKTREVNDCGIGYQVTVTMPVNCPLKEHIKGVVMTSRDTARQSAAMAACRRLHEIGELNEHLLPNRAVNNMVGFNCGHSDDEDSSHGKSGTRKRVRLFEEWIPHSMSLFEDIRSYFVYRLEMKLTNECCDARTRPWSNQTRCFGLLLSEVIPQIPRFPLFTKDGTVVVELSCVDESCRIDVARFKQLEGFHDEVMSKFARKHLSGAEFLRNAVKFNAIVAPLTKRSTKEEDSWCIDFDFVIKFQEAANDHLNVASRDFQDKDWICYYEDAIISTPYRPKMMHYVVTGVDTSLSPASSLGQGEKESFQEYYKRVYDLDVVSRQPLLDVVYSPSDTQLLAPRRDWSTGKGTSKRGKRRELLLPELCPRESFPASLYFQGVCLPAALYRLKCFLNAFDIRNLFNVQLKIKASEQCPATLGIDFFHQMASCVTSDGLASDELFTSFHEGLQTQFKQWNDVSSPSLLTVLQAITSRNARAGYDSESLEIVGDSFLKQAVSIFLYHHHKCTEYELSVRRSSMVSNKKLWRLACDRGIPTYIVDKPLFLESGQSEEKCYTYRWLLPGYVDDNEAKIPKESKEKIVPRQELSDKTVADCVEALIGAFLIDGGPLSAMDFMRWLGLDTFSLSEEEEGSKTPVSNYANYAAPSIQTDSCCEELMNLYDGHRMSALEKQLNYVFKNKALLIQALTHPSYYCNKLTSSYERMEFLGDALLDFLVTYFVVNSRQQIPPGQLTDIRQALVNNNSFGLLAIQHGYHKSLLQLVPAVFQDVNTFLELLATTENQYEKLLENPFIILRNGEGVHVPKCLGDIFESVAAAVFLDSGMDLATTWRVYQPMMAPVIKMYMNSVPLHPVRQLLEKCSQAEFSYANDDQCRDNGNLSPTFEVCTASAMGKTANAYAKKRKDAKAAAARALLSIL